MRIKSPGEVLPTLLAFLVATAVLLGAAIYLFVRVFWWVILLYIALHFATKYW